MYVQVYVRAAYLALHASPAPIVAQISLMCISIIGYYKYLGYLSFVVVWSLRQKQPQPQQQQQRL